MSVGKYLYPQIQLLSTAKFVFLYIFIFFYSPPLKSLCFARFANKNKNFLLLNNWSKNISNSKMTPFNQTIEDAKNIFTIIII